jgi:peptide/nickel transport system ATP-binding protein
VSALPELAPETAPSLIEVDDLHVRFVTKRGLLHAVNGVSLHLEPGEVAGIVGESGSGKSTVAAALMRLLPKIRCSVQGSVRLNGVDLNSLSEREMRRVRGKDIAMVFQDPFLSFNPVLTVGAHLKESLKLHTDLSGRALRARMTELLDLVGIPDAARQVDSYPHQMSGGMRQRIMIANAISCNPRVLIADEPTTALDVSVQGQILDLLGQLQRDLDMAMIVVSHDLGVLANLADRLYVMYAGEVAETGSTRQVLTQPGHPYTRALISCIPRVDKERPRRLTAIKGTPLSLLAPATMCPFVDRCPSAFDACLETNPPLYPIDGDHAAACLLVPLNDIGLQEAPLPLIDHPPTEDLRDEDTQLLSVAGLTVKFPVKQGGLRGGHGWMTAVDDVSLTIARRETLGLVGESGCGKTTLGRAILRLLDPTAGTITLGDVELTSLSFRGMRRERRHLQMVFQNPYSSLDPRMRIGELIREPLVIHGVGNRSSSAERVAELLTLVGLRPEFATRYPHEVSGGERQRIAIARALAIEPDLVICDEATSSLDVSVQAQILNLLEDLQERLGLAYLFISHNLAAVHHLAHRVAVMYLGRVVEIADRDDLYGRPLHPYTQSLLRSVPSLDVESEESVSHAAVRGDIPSPVSRPSGCPFHTRCPFAQVRCTTEVPELLPASDKRVVACHFWEEIDAGKVEVL